MLRFVIGSAIVHLPAATHRGSARARTPGRGYARAMRTRRTIESRLFDAVLLVLASAGCQPAPPATRETAPPGGDRPKW